MSGHIPLPAETDHAAAAAAARRGGVPAHGDPAVRRPARSRSRRSRSRWKRASASCWSRRRPPAKDEPGADDMYRVGCVATILQMLKLPDGTVKVLVEGVAARAHRASHRRRRATSSPRSTPVPLDVDADARGRGAAPRAAHAQFDQYVKLNKKIPPEILTSIAGIDDAGRLADTIAAHLPLKLEQKQQVLEMVDVEQAPRAPARRSSKARSTSCRSRSASAAASSARWRRASASTT